jgi:hypothetical protein
MDVMVLNCWVPATNDIDLASKDLDQLGEVGERTGQAVETTTISILSASISTGS